MLPNLERYRGTAGSGPRDGHEEHLGVCVAVYIGAAQSLAR